MELTCGAHHVGLTVADIRASADFFIQLLGWKEVGGNPDYPAIFVSDGVLMVTIWAARAETVVSFDKDRNVGLHHLAIRVPSPDSLEEIYRRLGEAGIRIEFSPEPLRQGPARHMMCYEPGGNRIEFIHVPQ